MVSKKKTRVVDDVVKNAPLKTKAYEQELRRLHVELVKLQQCRQRVKGLYCF